MLIFTGVLWNSSGVLPKAKEMVNKLKSLVSYTELLRALEHYTINLEKLKKNMYQNANIVFNVLWEVKFKFHGQWYTGLQFVCEKKTTHLNSIQSQNYPRF